MMLPIILANQRRSNDAYYRNRKTQEELNKHSGSHPSRSSSGRYEIGDPSTFRKAPSTIEKECDEHNRKHLQELEEDNDTIYNVYVDPIPPKKPTRWQRFLKYIGWNM